MTSGINNILPDIMYTTLYTYLLYKGILIKKHFNGYNKVTRTKL